MLRLEFGDLSGEIDWILQPNLSQKIPSKLVRVNWTCIVVKWGDFSGEIDRILQPNLSQNIPGVSVNWAFVIKRTNSKQGRKENTASAYYQFYTSDD
jgi:hypothetical protein